MSDATPSPVDQLTNDYATSQLNQLNMLVSQNQQLQEINETYSTNNSKINQITMDLANMNFYDNLFFWVYYAVAVVYIVMLYVTKSKYASSIYFVAILAVLILTFPFYILPMQSFLWSLYTYALSFTTGTAYQIPSIRTFGYDFQILQSKF